MKKIVRDFINISRKSKVWIKTSIIVFLLALALGVLTFFLRDLPTFVIASSTLTKIAELGKQAKAADFWGRFIIIYRNNLTSMLIVLFGGVFLGIPTLVGLFINGLILGFFTFILLFSNLPIFNKGIALLLLLPHGIIEIGAFLLAASWGLKLGLEHLLPTSKGKRTAVFIDNLKSSFLIFFLVAGGLAVAALIEVLDMKLVEILVR